jgi:hypothetical protein
VTTYEFLKDVGAFGGLGWLAKTLFGIYKKRLTRRERELLVAATTTPDMLIHYFNFPNIGRPWVRSGKFDLGNCPLTQAEFVDALHLLAANGYLSSTAPSLYTLSSRGMKAAKRFGSTIDLAAIPCDQNKVLPTVGAVLC